MRRRRGDRAQRHDRHLRIPQCVEGYSLLRIGNDIPLRTAVLFEPFVIGTRGVKTLGVKPGDSAIVFGAGIIGLTSAIMLQWYGCEKVMVVDLSEYRLENARKFGFLTCNFKTEDLQEKAFAAFGTERAYPGEKCSAKLYVDAVGVASVIDNFAMLAPRNGTISIVGVHKAPVQLDLTAVSFNNWHIHGCGEVDTEAMAGEITDMMRSGRYDLSSLVTHEFPIDQINEALTVAGNAQEAQKVCISFDTVDA